MRQRQASNILAEQGNFSVEGTGFTVMACPMAAAHLARSTGARKACQGVCARPHPGTAQILPSVFVQQTADCSSTLALHSRERLVSQGCGCLMPGFLSHFTRPEYFTADAAPSPCLHGNGNHGNKGKGSPGKGPLPSTPWPLPRSLRFQRLIHVLKKYLRTAEVGIPW